MSFYSRHILPKIIETTCATKPVAKQREKVIPLARGRVLEIGAGGGLNLEYYDAARVHSVIGLDPSEPLLATAAARARQTGLAFEPLLAGAEKTGLASGSIDSVVVTYTLCSVPDMAAALAEARRVLAPGGQLIFCEHGAAPDASVLRMQRLLTPVWRRLGGNCHLARDIPAAIAAAGFHIDRISHMYLPGTWKFAGFNNWGTASPA